MRYPDYFKCDRCGAVIFDGDDYIVDGFERRLCADCMLELEYIEDEEEPEDEEEVYN